MAVLILVLAPMRSELRPVVRALSARRDRTADTLLYRARRHGRDVVAAPLGVGPAVARRTTTALLDRLGPGVEHVVVSGIAGGLDPAATVGTVLVPEVVIDLENGREVRPARLGPRRPAGTVATAAELIVDRRRLDGLLARGVIALDMETAGVGEVCEERGVPWTAFRAVSDRPDDGLVDGSVFSLLNEDGTADVRGGIRFVLSHPGRLPGLVRLARDSSRGCGLAARAAVEALPGA